MIYDVTETEYGIEGKMHCTLFDKEIEVMMEESVDLQYAQQCAADLNNLSPETISAICKALKAYCLYALEAWRDAGEDLTDRMTIAISEMTDERDILKCIYPALTVDEPAGKGIGYRITGSCDWELEHGFTIALLNGRLCYCGIWYEADAWSDFYPMRSMNFANRK